MKELTEGIDRSQSCRNQLRRTDAWTGNFR